VDRQNRVRDVVAPGTISSAEPHLDLGDGD
jgi:hypothetical protein